MKALSALSKFLGMYEEFKRLIKAYGLKWQSVNVDDLIISRLTRTERSKDVIEWIRRVKEKLPRLGVFLDFVLSSGLRYEESIKAFNLIIDLSKEDMLGNYYNAETEFLEHFHFKKLFIRRTKKAFVSFVPRRLVERVGKQEKLSQTQINKLIQRRDLKLRFSDVREFYATYMVRYLKQPEIDFLQGRVSSSVFMRNYFNPALIGDLKERALRGVEELSDKAGFGVGV
jgi:intergrase/recombinase